MCDHTLVSSFEACLVRSEIDNPLPVFQKENGCSLRALQLTSTMNLDMGASLMSPPLVLERLKLYTMNKEDRKKVV